MQNWSASSSELMAVTFYLRDLPFHHSQKEIASGEDWTDFEYWLRISNDFYTPLLSRGPNIKVPQPQWLADEIRQQLLKAAGLYVDELQCNIE